MGGRTLPPVMAWFTAMHVPPGCEKATSHRRAGRAIEMLRTAGALEDHLIQHEYVHLLMAGSIGTAAVGQRRHHRVLLRADGDSPIDPLPD
jgi:hypothetical protein